MQAFTLGIAASLFFSVTFILNHTMQSAGGHWAWTASLRFVFMLPVLFLITLPGQRYRHIFHHLRGNPLPWLGWSTIGFGFFYLPVCMAASFGPPWLVAAGWQITIVAGIILTPFIARGAGGERAARAIPLAQLLISLLIIAGVVLVLYTDGDHGELAKNLAAIGLILIGAFAYPLGNRKIMALMPKSFTTMDRVFAMTLCSMPFWVLIMGYGAITGNLPIPDQTIQAAMVALCSGVIATWLFFRATELVKHNPRHLAVVESTQAGEVIFTLVLGIASFDDQLPSLRAMLGLGVIIGGLVLNGTVAKHGMTPVRQG